MSLSYDCGGKGHGPDVSEVQWCRDCTPVAAVSAGAETEPLCNECGKPMDDTEMRILDKDCLARLRGAQGEPPQALDVDRDRFAEAVALALSDESWQDPRVDISLPDLLGDSILYHRARLSRPSSRHDEPRGEDG